MNASIVYGEISFVADLGNGIDISIPLRAGKENVNAFYIPAVEYTPFRVGEFVGEISQGGSCNVMNVCFNPHGNGTHTESVGHISTDKYPIYQSLTEYFFVSKLITIAPEEKNGDRFITAEQITIAVGTDWPEALVIRSLPNSEEKINFQYSGTNPVYMDPVATLLLKEKDVKHLLVDFPSIDREEDGGKLLAHKNFWNYPVAPRKACTVTELIFVPDSVFDGLYLLNLQTASFDNDASPSKPVLFPLVLK